MLKRIIIFYLVPLLIISCNSSKKNYLFKDSTKKYYVEINESERNGSIDTLLTFYDFKDISKVKELGFYKNGFRNDLWSYNLQFGIETIKWSYYKDENLNFETNLFAKADSVKYSELSTKFLFRTELGEIILNITINGPLKDSVPLENYKKITTRELENLGANILLFESNKLDSSINDIYVNNLEIEMPSTNDHIHIKSIFGFIEKDTFVEFSVSTSNIDNYLANILFDAVLTSFYLDGNMLYNPFDFEL